MIPCIGAAAIPPSRTATIGLPGWADRAFFSALTVGGVVEGPGAGEHHQEGVDLVGLEERGGEGPQVGGAHPRAGVDRVAGADGAGDVAGDLSRQVVGQLGHLEAVAGRRVGRQDAQATGVAQDRRAGDPRAAAARRAAARSRSAPRHAAADHARLREQGVDAHRRGGGGGGVRDPGPPPCPSGRRRPRAAACARRSGGRPGRTSPGCRRTRGRARPRVTSRVVAPGRQQVVAGDVGLVAERDEVARRPGPEPRARSITTMPTPPDCEAIASPPRRRVGPAKVALSRTSGWLSSRPEAVGPDHAGCRGRAPSEQLALEARARAGPISAKPGGDHHGRTGAGGGRPLDACRAPARGHGDDEQVDGPGASANDG